MITIKRRYVEIDIPEDAQENTGTHGEHESENMIQSLEKDLQIPLKKVKKK